MKRRDFLRSAALGTAGVVSAKELLSSDTRSAPVIKPALATGGADYSPATGQKRTAIPSACWQCVSCCPIVGFVEDGRLVKIEGNPLSSSTRGRLCPRGQAGINQVYDPDRLLHPLKRAGSRGEGKWEQISWDKALDLLLGHLDPLLEGSPLIDEVGHELGGVHLAPRHHGEVDPIGL